MIGTMFAVLLAFTIFYALQNYQRARDGGTMEAISVTEPHGDLICYSRAVVADEWPAMQRGESSASVQHWVDTMVEDFAATDPGNPKQEAAYGQWFQQAERRDGRRARAAAAEPSVPLPLPLWIVLGIGATAIFTYMCVRADRRESAVIQAVPIAFVSALMTSALLVVAFLDHPYDDWAGSLQPNEMRVTLTLIDDGHVVPCDANGERT